VLDISIRCAGRGRYTIAVCGDLDILSGPRLLAQVTGVTAAEPAEIVVDMHDVRFCDAAGIRILMSARAATAKAGGLLTVVRPRGLVETVLYVTGTAGQLGLPALPHVGHAAQLT
jgi:anti-anti-sigma factor